MPSVSGQVAFRSSFNNADQSPVMGNWLHLAFRVEKCLFDIAQNFCFCVSGMRLNPVLTITTNRMQRTGNDLISNVDRDIRKHHTAAGKTDFNIS